jgi:hypothetical protein
VTRWLRLRWERLALWGWLRTYDLGIWMQVRGEDLCRWLLVHQPPDRDDEDYQHGTITSDDEVPF